MKAIEILTSLNPATILDYGFIVKCSEETMQALLEIGNVQNANSFLDLYEGFELGEFIKEITE
jgi:hypothetical protein